MKSKLKGAYDNSYFCYDHEEYIPIILKSVQKYW